MKYAGHSAITVASTAVVVYSMVQVSVPPEMGQFVIYGMLTNLAIHPDLDQAENLRGKPWMFMWWPYGKLMRHRSFLSHGPIISTAIRLAYIGIVLVAITSIVRSYGIQINLGENALTNLLLFFIGLSISDTLHYIADIVSTKFKKWR